MKHFLGLVLIIGVYTVLLSWLIGKAFHKVYFEKWPTREHELLHVYEEGYKAGLNHYGVLIKICSQKLEECRG